MTNRPLPAIAPTGSAPLDRIPVNKIHKPMQAGQRHFRETEKASDFAWFPT
jgi:hypothetical protein